MRAICAGRSDIGMALSTWYTDFNFCFGKGINTPTALTPTIARIKQVAEQTGRDAGSHVLSMVIADEIGDAACAKWEHYRAGADEETLGRLTEQNQKDTHPGADTNIHQMVDPASAINISMEVLVGFHASAARMLGEVASIPGAEDALLTFDDFLSGIEDFGERIQLLTQCRAHLPMLTQEVV